MSKPPKPNPARERRIDYEIVVDANTPEERAMGWYYYLEEKLCVSLQGEVHRGAVVLAAGEGSDCKAEIFVLIRFAGHKLGFLCLKLN